MTWMKRLRFRAWKLYFGYDSDLSWKTFTKMLHVYTRKTNRIRGFEFSVSWQGRGFHASGMEYK